MRIGTVVLQHVAPKESGAADAIGPRGARVRPRGWFTLPHRAEVESASGTVVIDATTADRPNRRNPGWATGANVCC